jgi:hypothetical protein
MTQLAVSHLRLATPRRGDSATPASDKDKGGVSWPIPNRAGKKLDRTPPLPKLRNDGIMTVAYDTWCNLTCLSQSEGRRAGQMTVSCPSRTAA